MKKIAFGMAVLILFIVTLPLHAQEEERDVVEVGFFGGVGIPAGGLSDWKTYDRARGAKTGWDIGLEAGCFLTPRVVLGVNFVYTQFSIDVAGDQTNHNHRLYNPNVYVKYLFEGESNLIPYLKGHVGVENPKFSTFV
jgi:hypothetical protein